MQTLKIGLIGCGAIVQLVHLNTLLRLPGIEILAIAEPDIENQAMIHQRVRSTILLTDYQKLLKIPEITAVIICLPTNLHAQATILAMESGKHVYLEKPLAATLTEGKAVIEAWKHSKVIGGIGFNLRFNKLYQTAKEHIKSGKLGKLLAVRSVSSSGGTLSAWKEKRSSGGGSLLELASHHIDLVRFIFEQEVAEVFAKIWSERGEDDQAALQLHLKNGLLIQSFFSLNSVSEDRIEIYGEFEKISIDRFSSVDLEIDVKLQPFSRLKWLAGGLSSLALNPYPSIKKLVTPSNEPSYQAALANFIDAVRFNHPVSPNLLDGYHSLKVIAAAAESAKNKQLISIAD